MNVFNIPSWYPTKDHPHAGIFTLEQVQLLAQAKSKDKFAISLWGQKEESKLLWAKDHFKNISKLLKKDASPKHEKQLESNLQEYYTPAYTWTEKILWGNIYSIIKSNEQNFLRFKKDAGNVSLIHAHVSFPAGYVALHLAKKYSLPYIITEQMSPFPFGCFLSQGKVIPKVLSPLQHADAVIAISPAAALDIQHITSVKALVIPNLVNEKLFTPLKEEKVSTNSFTFFTLGRMVPQKGIPDLLEAISRIKNRSVNFKIGGDGDHLHEYKRIAENLHINRKIQWLGELTREEAAYEFQHCNAFVLPSIHESMGVVYAEALACGKPIIATRSGGPEFIVKEHNGLLVDVHAPDQLANAMEYIVAQYKRYSPAKIREDFMARFSSSAITQDIYSLYESVLSKQQYRSLQNS